MRMDPPASVAWAMGTIPAATAAAAPPEDPPAVSSGARGLRQGGCPSGSDASDRPNSGLVVRPKGTRPALRKRAPRSDSACGSAAITSREPDRGGKPRNGPPRSLASVGTPAKGMLARIGSESSRESMAEAAARPRAGSAYETAPSAALSESAAREASRASPAVSAPLPMASARAVASGCISRYFGSAMSRGTSNSPALMAVRTFSISATASAGGTLST